jgi:hypothetical protein
MATDIFISHAAIDEELALALKSHLQLCFPGLDIFASSDPEDLQPGDLWVDKILAALETAKCVLVITTTRGLSRKWVWFESGRTWFNSVPLIPCCVGTLRKTGLPPPYSFLQALEIDEAADVTLLQEKLASLLGLASKNAETAALAATLTRLDIRAEERQKFQRDHYAGEMLETIGNLMKTLNYTEQRTIRQFVMFGRLSTAASKTMAADAGLDMEKWSVPWSLARRTGWLTHVSGGGNNDANQDSVYAINEQISPHLKEFFDPQ